MMSEIPLQLDFLCYMELQGTGQHKDSQRAQYYRIRDSMIAFAHNINIDNGESQISCEQEPHEVLVL